jgi:hypothetical protein
LIGLRPSSARWRPHSINDRANEFARNHPELLTAYVTHTFGLDDVQAAFELACRPTPERIKIAIVE